MARAKQTSEEWQKQKPELEVYDPDGWNRANYHYSWFKEKITEAEYDKRVLKSTVKFRRCSKGDGDE